MGRICCAGDLVEKLIHVSMKGPVSTLLQASHEVTAAKTLPLSPVRGFQLRSDQGDSVTDTVITQDSMMGDSSLIEDDSLEHGLNPTAGRLPVQTAILGGGAAAGTSIAEDESELLPAIPSRGGCNTTSYHGRGPS